MRVFATMQAVVLRSFIDGTLPRNKLKDRAVGQTIATLPLDSMDQPTVYNIALVDKSCRLSSALVLRETMKLVRLNCTVDGTLNDEQLATIFAVDTTSSPVHHTAHWSLADLETENLRYHLSSPDGQLQWTRLDAVLCSYKTLEQRSNAYLVRHSGES